MEWQKLFAVSVGKHSMGNTVDALIAQHAAVFEPGLGCFKGPDMKIKLQANAQPKFCSARPVPFAMRDEVEAELQRMEREEI